MIIKDSLPRMLKSKKFILFYTNELKETAVDKVIDKGKSLVVPINPISVIDTPNSL